MTDVNIAVESLADAYRDLFDTAILVSADSDLAPVIVKVRELFPEKRVLVAFPPERRSHRLTDVAHGRFYVNRAHLLRSRLPERIEKRDGATLVLKIFFLTWSLLALHPDNSRHLHERSRSVLRMEHPTRTLRPEVRRCLVGPIA